eukprot:29661-Pelagococcus_subviridis.AAC.11
MSCRHSGGRMRMRARRRFRARRRDGAGGRRARGRAHQPTRHGREDVLARFPSVLVLALVAQRRRVPVPRRRRARGDDR